MKNATGSVGRVGRGASGRPVLASADGYAWKLPGFVRYEHAPIMQAMGRMLRRVSRLPYRTIRSLRQLPGASGLRHVGSIHRSLLGLALAVAAFGSIPAAPASPLHASAAQRPTGPRIWRPPTGTLQWQWELDHPLRLNNASDMGIRARTYTGAAAANPTVYDIDGFENSATTVAALHARKDRVICYIEVGAAERYRPDYHRFPTSVLGRVMPGYPAERYLDIRSTAVLSIIKARIAMCARKGFDAIEPDIDDSYTDKTGFPITRAINIAYDIKLAHYAHHLGLAFALKNGDEPAFAAAMLPHVDFALDEQCFDYSTCNAFYPRFLRAHKAVLEVEYRDQGAPPAPRICPLANRMDFDTLYLNSNLAGGRMTCR